MAPNHGRRVDSAAKFAADTNLFPGATNNTRV